MIKIMEPGEIREALKDRKMREIARRLSINVSTLSSFNTGKSEALSLKNTIKLTEYFGR